jgi:thiamine pyrophosphokinase
MHRRCRCLVVVAFLLSLCCALHFSKGFTLQARNLVNVNELSRLLYRHHPVTKIMDAPSVEVVVGNELLTIHHRSPLVELHELSHLGTCTNGRTALIILNAPILSPMSPLFQLLWNSSNYRVCADGGANRLLNVCRKFHHSKNDDETAGYIPDCITGDLDSLLPATRQFYEEKGVKIVPIADQDTNDLDKAIAAVLDHFSSSLDAAKESIRCVVYGAFGGRFDQEMASFQSLYRHNATSLRLFLYDDHTMAFLLRSGCINRVQLLPSNGAELNVCEGPTCGLIPLGCAVDSVTTQGLQWNLLEQPTFFGGLVSTSNRIISSEVQVVCSQPLVFTAQVHAGVNTVWSENGS